MDDQRTRQVDHDDDAEVGDIDYLAGAIDVEGDLVEVAHGLWAIHGRWPYDGDVILAEYTSVTQAQLVLDHVRVPGASEADVDLG